MIRRAKDPDEYFTERLVYVNNLQDTIPLDDTFRYECMIEKPVNRTLKKGTLCRCWVVSMQMV